jgi:hypothetical protein
MSVVVDDAGSDHQTSRVDDPARLAAHPSDFDNLPAANSHVAVKCRETGPVDNFAVFDDQIVSHCASSAPVKFAGVDIVVQPRNYSLTRSLST